MATRGPALFLIALATLLAELSLTRLVSAGLFAPFALWAVSTALLGTGVAGVVGLWVPARDPERVSALAALGAAASLPVAWSLAQLLAPEPLRILAEPSQLLRVGASFLVLAVPFVGAGLAIATILKAYASDAPRYYGFDLVGAAVGSFAALLVVGAGPGALWLASAALALGGALLARGQTRKIGFGGALVASGAFFWVPLPLHISRDKLTQDGRPWADVLRDSKLVAGTQWSSMGRVDWLRLPNGQERLIFDGGAAAVRIPNRAPAVPHDATLPYEFGAQSALIVGSGAGWEVAEAKAMGVPKIVAVEINLDVMEHVPRALMPGVDWVVTDGRGYLERTERTFDAIVMIHTISNAATAAGALALAEDYLFTQEALARLVDRLSSNGFLLITRPEAQLPRLLATLRACAPLEGHVYLWAERSAASSFYGALLYSKQPFSADARQKIEARIQSRGLRLLLGPSTPARDPVLAGLVANDSLESLELQLGAVLTPASDAKPFFHQRRRFGSLTWADLEAASGARGAARMALEEQPLAELSAVAVLLETVVIGGLVLLLPLLRIRREGPLLPTLAYFGALGLGFMWVELALVAQLRLILGPPTISFAAVFAGLLLGAGAGSFLGARWVRARWAPVVAAVAVAAMIGVLPSFLRWGLQMPEWAAILASTAVVMPLGAALGLPFPLGLQRLAVALVPWAWSVNAFASVAGAVLALILGASLGFPAVMACGAGCYAVAALAGRKL